MQSKEARAAMVRKLAEERSKRTPKQQIAKLDALLGVGVGAVKERARLATQIAKGQEKVQTVTKPENLIEVPEPENPGTKAKKPRAPRKEKAKA